MRWPPRRYERVDRSSVQRVVEARVPGHVDDHAGTDVGGVDERAALFDDEGPVQRAALFDQAWVVDLAVSEEALRAPFVLGVARRSPFRHFASPILSARRIARFVVLTRPVEEHPRIVLQNLLEEFQGPDVVDGDARRARHQAAHDGPEGARSQWTATDDVFAQVSPVAIDHGGAAAAAMLQRDDESLGERDVARDGLLGAFALRDHRVGATAQAARR